MDTLANRLLLFNVDFFFIGNEKWWKNDWNTYCKLLPTLIKLENSSKILNFIEKNSISEMLLQNKPKLNWYKLNCRLFFLHLNRFQCRHSIRHSKWKLGGCKKKIDSTKTCLSKQTTSNHFKTVLNHLYFTYNSFTWNPQF